jgi:hypothetical protein
MRLQHRADLAIPSSVKWIGDAASTNGDWRRGQMPICLHAAGGSLTEPGLGGRDVLWMVRTELHKQPLLLAGDVSSGHFGSRRGC